MDYYPSPKYYRCGPGLPSGVQLKVRTQPEVDARILGYLKDNYLIKVRPQPCTTPCRTHFFVTYAVSCWRPSGPGQEWGLGHGRLQEHGARVDADAQQEEPAAHR